MLEQGENRAERLSLARAQALKASGAEGAGFVGAMHWQAAHIAGPLRALKAREQAPLGQALAAASWALVLILQAMCMAEPAGGRAVEVPDALAEARAELAAAERHLRRLDEQTADLAGELEGVIAAAEDAMRAQGNGQAD
jgi:hypothetical protein